ncbi:MEIOTIC F-BOX protein MOF-like [Triticum aestivum]|uniref:MEIOTIC F-BOX protein MOF-like n=1 Tax=Triticum aestivum TaxID=4565 RepID=UPI000842A6AE|nr:MEIOTIC F-BOX protein MOF-like [Triticum aestivum]
MLHTSTAGKSSNSKSSREDRISDLPDDVLHHVLGFLRADQAVRTCLLARRWRHLWKSMRCLRINDMGSWRKSTDVFRNKFISCLLLLRDPGSTLDEVEIEYNYSEEYHHSNNGGPPWVGIWIQHALSSRAQVLTVKLTERAYFYLCLYGPLISQYLRRLEISDVRLKSSFLDFSSCSELVDLNIKDCTLDARRILSQSLKHLSISGCAFPPNGSRIRISVPNLVSLQLIKIAGRTPLLESMPSLETAVVRPCNISGDNCHNGVLGEFCGICQGCCGNDGHNDGCILFEGLSHAKNLELIQTYPQMFIFRRDLTWCPIFSNLKTLLMNQWCVQPDFSGLVCMLEHSPVLENLTLQLCKQGIRKCASEVEENPGLLEKPPTISGYLKIIKVKCEGIDDRVCKVLKFLSTFGIEIAIQRTNG